MGSVPLGPCIASCLNVRARRLVVCLLLAPGLCLAQTLPISISGGVVVNGVNRFGPIHCGTTFSVSWGIPTPAQLTTVCAIPEFWITASTCGDHPASGDLTLVPTQPLTTSSRSGTFNSVSVTDLPIFQGADGGGACGVYSASTTLYVCGSVKYNNSLSGCGFSDFFVHGSNPPLQYRGSAPSGPSSFDVTGLDSALKVNASASSDVSLIHVEIRQSGVGDFGEAGSFSPDQGSVKISGLQNGTAYDVRVYDDDGVGNYSARTDPITATPIASDGFYQTYRRLGGTDTGGCAGALPGALILPLVFGVYRLLRRKR